MVILSELLLIDLVIHGTSFVHRDIYVRMYNITHLFTAIYNITHVFTAIWSKLMAFLFLAARPGVHIQVLYSADTPVPLFEPFR